MKTISLVIATVVTALVGPAHAGSVAGFGGATEITQILNMGELLYQSDLQYSMVQDNIKKLKQMEKDIRQFANPLDLGQINSIYGQVVNEVRNARALTYGVQSSTARFQQLNPGYNPGRAYDPQAYANRSKVTDQAILNAIQAGDSMFSRAQTEQQRIQALGQKVNNPEGQAQMLQTANAVQYEVLQQLRDTKMYTQQVNDAQMSYLSDQKTGKDDDKAAADLAINGLKARYGIK